VQDQDHKCHYPHDGHTDGSDARQRAALHQHQHQSGDRHHQQQGAEIVDPAVPGLHLFSQERRNHGDGGNADRQIDPEHQLPAYLLDQERAE